MEQGLSENDSQNEPGESLRLAREAAGLTTKEVADSLNLLLTNIEAIEINQYDRIAGIFIRGYVKNYARFLGLDADALVAAADLRLKSKGASAVSAKASPMRNRFHGERAGIPQMTTAHTVLAALITAAVIWVAVSLMFSNQGDDIVAEPEHAPVTSDVEGEG